MILTSLPIIDSLVTYLLKIIIKTYMPPLIVRQCKQLIIYLMIYAHHSKILYNMSTLEVIPPLYHLPSMIDGTRNSNFMNIQLL
jgi:hypothetical protein